MKIRNGFVSNSSSSSFIVGFTSIPETKGQLLDIMFPKDMEYLDGETSVSSVVSRVWQDLEGAKPMTKEEIIEELQCGTYEDGIYSNWQYEALRKKETEVMNKIDKKFCEKYKCTTEKCYDYKDWNKELNTARDKFWEDQRKLSLKLAKEFMKDNFTTKEWINKIPIKFEYEDHGAFGCVMEHGDIFRNLPHIRISKH